MNKTITILSILLLSLYCFGQNDEIIIPEIEQAIIDEGEIIEDLKAEEVKPVKEPEIFTIVEQMPSFPGGQKACIDFIYSKLKFPETDDKEFSGGLVVLSFVVNEDGTLSDIVVLRDIGYACGEEAVRVVKSMPRWTPGMQRGRAVKVSYKLPVRFKDPKKVEKKKKQNVRNQNTRQYNTNSKEIIDGRNVVNGLIDLMKNRKSKKTKKEKNTKE